MHPETKQAIGRELVQKRWNTSDNLSRVCDKSEVNDNLSFCQDTSEKTGLSERTIQRAIQIAENLTPEVKEFGKEIGYYDKQKRTVKFRPLFDWLTRKNYSLEIHFP